MEKLTRFEITRLISARALQIALGAPPLIKPKKDKTAIEIAKKEYEKKNTPFISNQNTTKQRNNKSRN